ALREEVGGEEEEAGGVVDQVGEALDQDVEDIVGGGRLGEHLVEAGDAEVGGTADHPDQGALLGAEGVGGERVGAPAPRRSALSRIASMMPCPFSPLSWRSLLAASLVAASTESPAASVLPR